MIREWMEIEDKEGALLRIIERAKRNEFNEFITVNEQAALSEGELRGLPVAVKDNISTKGIETTCASRILKGYVPPYDAHVVELLKNSGASIVGKTNMDEFAMGTTSETSYFGPVRNPWDKRRVAGGSSGGSAAAVAGGVVPAALGSDTGGSVRCPASFCGIVGLKPTYGAVSRYGLIAYANSLEQIGVFGNTVEDVAIIFNIIKGRDERDATSMDSEDVLPLREDVGKVRIGVPKEFFGEGVDEGVEREVWNAIKLMEDLGAEYEEISMRYMRYALPAYYIIAMSEASSNLARYDGIRYGLRFENDEDFESTISKIRAEGFGKEVKRRILLGTYALSKGYYGRYYLKALKVRRLIKEEFERALKKFDVLATPTMPFVAPKIGEIKDPLSLYMADVNTVPVNLAGVPAISVPCGLSDGLPVGLQLIGRRFGERRLLEIARWYEGASNFRRLS
ncbi:MAG: aspartyl-tRNA(Asn)/glutamyl-tRNA(Gln) amidotransferase subunit [Archaeoglobi archaeon]|nr:aspartyl-tRNA(Asn)/glutamyl-tRNA(Gln) amidotransferase subunit [Archaeoglobi archaeon]